MNADKSLGWSITLSVLMIVAGLLAIFVPMVAGITVTLFIAWLLIFSGVAHLIFSWHRRGVGGIVWEVLVGLLYIAIGGYILLYPVAGLASLTLALAFYLFVEGILELVLGFQLTGVSGRGWLFADGIINFILAVIIWKTWLLSTAWVIGTLVGIGILFTGVSRLMLSLAARRAMGAVKGTTVTGGGITAA